LSLVYSYAMDNLVSLPLIFSTALAVNLSGALSPGPLLVVTINESARRGFWAGPLIVLGHMLPEIVMVIALTGGAGEIMKSAVASHIIWLVGGFILLAMGINITWKNRHAVLIASGDGTSQKTGRLILTAVLASISNPYWFIWWATAGTAYVIWAAQMGTSGIIFFFVGHIMADLIWYTIVSFAISRGRKIMNDKVYRGLMIGSGSIVIVLGIYFAISGIKYFVS